MTHEMSRSNADIAAWKAFDDYIDTHKGRKLQKS